MANTSPAINERDIASFRAYLAKSKRIVAVLGAGLSASSGLPTFRGAGGLWRTHDAISLATPGAFQRDPGLVWQFYSYRRHMALNAKPNPAHMALAAFSKLNPNFLTLSQNVDGLSPRAGHPSSQLKLLHGSLFDVKCWDQKNCCYIRQDDFTDPIVPGLAIPTAKALDSQQQQNAEQHTTPEAHPLMTGLDVANVLNPLPSIPTSDLPHCPHCKRNLLRPGVVWFGEQLPEDVLSDVEDYFNSPEKIDLVMVIGTSSQVYPAAGYADEAREKGARVAVINMDPESGANLRTGDWFFQGDAALIIPELLRDQIETH